MYFFKSPVLAESLTPSALWKIETREKKLFLTFDDGPNPQSTPYILSVLESFNISATFFCLGKNVLEFNDLYAQILQNGHKTGNHTFDHVDLWKTSKNNYLENVRKADDLIGSGLFRPPYGHLTPLVYNHLKRKYQIVMWSLMSYDFDPGIDSSRIIEVFKRKSAPGSIWLFHDNEKAKKNVQNSLPFLIEYFLKEGFVFESIGDKKIGK